MHESSGNNKSKLSKIRGNRKHSKNSSNWINFESINLHKWEKVAWQKPIECSMILCFIQVNVCKLISQYCKTYQWYFDFDENLAIFLNFKGVLKLLWNFIFFSSGPQIRPKLKDRIFKKPEADWKILEKEYAHFHELERPTAIFKIFTNFAFIYYLLNNF